MKTLNQRFWGKVDKRPGQGPKGHCWIWTGCIAKITGYGLIDVNGKLKGAHRIAFLLQFGTIDPTLNVLHKCDNPACVRGSHLWQGNDSDNMKDCVAKGRHYSPQKVKTRCAQGHPYDETNTYYYVYPNGNRKRQCRKCNATYERNRYAKRTKTQ
jgi:HNH endonuclease